MVITVTEAQYSLKLSVALLVSRVEEKNMKYDVVIPIIFTSVVAFIWFLAHTCWLLT